MFFPVSGVEVSPFVPVVAAFGISFFCSMGGISGAFLLLPFQMSVLGYTAPSVSATNHVFNVTATPGGVYRFIKEGRMVWPLAAVTAAGTVPGTLVGSCLRVTYLPDPTTFRLFAACVLAYIGLRLVFDLLRRKMPDPATAPARPFTPPETSPPDAEPIAEQVASPAFSHWRVRIEEASLKRIRYTFGGSACACSTPGVFFLCLAVGVIGGAYGIGGGAIIAPFLVSMYALPIYTIAGTTLFTNFLTALSGLIFFLCLAPFFPEMSVAPDWKLGLLFGLGGFIGIYCGARLQKYVPERYIKQLLAAVLIGTAVKYLVEIL